MSTDIAFELHSYSGGRWKIQGFFDDRELAMSEAHRMEDSRRYPAVRVVEERFDPESGGYRSRTIYRSSAVDQHNEIALKDRADTRREVQASRNTRQDSKAKSAKSGSSSPALTMIALKAILLFALGFAAIWALNRYGGA